MTATSAYTEDTLVQQTTAECLRGRRFSKVEPGREEAVPGLNITLTAYSE